MRRGRYLGPRLEGEMVRYGLGISEMDLLFLLDDVGWLEACLCGDVRAVVFLESMSGFRLFRGWR